MTANSTSDSSTDVNLRPAPRVVRPEQLALKRATDVLLSAGSLIVFAPLLVLVAAAICLDSKGDPIFRQKRVGKGGELFDIYKFRTMHVGTPEVATELMLKMDSSPITKVGAFLRKTSLDELPQLANVLFGDMSVVGPRPALYNQYELTEKRRAAGVLSMPPGITGWAQVNGRDELTDDEKVEADAWYLNNWHYALDWRIILMTVKQVIDRRGAV